MGLGFFTLEMGEVPSILPAPWTEVPDVRVLVNGTVVSKGTPVDSRGWWPRGLLFSPGEEEGAARRSRARRGGGGGG